MEARGRRVGGGFPGYNGPALPRAMRSARGRGEAGRQTSEIGGRAGFFELLATVAGQFLQDASVGQEQESDKLKQKSSQVADSMLVTSSQKLQIGNSPCLGPCHSGSDDRDMWKHNVALSKQNSLSGGAPLAANSCDSSVAVQQNTAAVNEDQLLESGASPFSNISCEFVSPEAMDPVEGGAAKSSQALGGCSHDGKVMNGDCHSGTACTRQEIDNIENLENGVDLGAQGEMPGLCKTSEMPHKQNMDGNDHCLCNMLWEESHSCDIASDAQDHIQSMSKDSRGPNSDSCDGTAVVKEETVEQVSSRQTPVQQSLDAVKDHGDASIDVNMDARMDLEDYVESNRHVCIAEKKLDNTMCESQDFKPVVDAGNSLSVNVSSIEEAVGSEEAEQGGTQSKYTMQEDPGEIRPVDHLAENKVCRGLRRKTSDSLREANMKDSYAKGSKARKLAKVARHTRGSGSCSKRKHAEMELQSDTDVVHGKRGFFGDIAFTRQRTSRSFSAKRKKMEEGTDNLLPNLELNGKPLTVECADAKAASVASSPTAGPSKLPSKKSAEPHVKLSIKSFTVPEFLVDLPESATVANLKRAVMDAAMELLGGGLRVRVLLQGKKVPDEGVSLGQMGISRHGKPESLGFMLEPSPVPPSPTAAEDPLLVLSRAAAQPSPRYPVFTVPGLPVTGDAGRAPCKSRANKGSSVLEADGAFGTVACEQQIVGDPNGLSFAVEPDDSTNGCNGSKSLPHDPSDDSLVSASGAIILHPSIGGENMQGMALVPVRQKLRAIDTSKRRIRRPFSVAEVEALVHAVEKLGTGRWRDVKLRAFDQAKHRTYVDLKDKWKTLVHTARIAPHQRRGEPVPQELLERVTRAHTYWAAQQAKQQADLDF